MDLLGRPTVQRAPPPGGGRGNVVASGHMPHLRRQDGIVEALRDGMPAAERTATEQGHRSRWSGPFSGQFQGMAAEVSVADTLIVA